MMPSKSPPAKATVRATTPMPPRGIASQYNNPLRRAVACLFALLIPIAPAAADLFKIDRIDVDKQGGDAVAARNDAIVEAEERGLDLLLRRLTATVDHAKLPAAAELGARRYVRSIDIAQERLSPTRYVASINVAYQQDRVLEFLRNRALAHITQERPDILVVPVKSENGVLSISPASEPWGGIWRRIGASGGIVGWRLINGDAADMVDLDASRGGLDLAVFSNMANRYNAGELMLAVQEGEATTGIRYNLQGAHGIDLERTGLIVATDPAEQTLALKRVLDQSTEHLASQWKAGHLVRADQVSRLDLEVGLENFQDWVQVHGELERIALVRTVNIWEFARTYAKITLNYVGERNDLDAALRARGLVLLREGDLWQLRLVDGLPGPGG